MSWRTSTLGDVLTLKRGHDLPEGARVPGDVPVVSSSGITGWHNTAMADPPGVVTGRYGTIGEVFFLDEPYWPLNTSLYVIDFKGNDPKFSEYLLRNTLRNYRSEKAAVPGVNRNVLHTLDVSVPDLQTQRKIVSALSAYDDLIENNRRRIALLEEAARLLYREWFVHFRFPGHEHTQFIDGLPEGWQRCYLGDVVSTQYGYTASASVEEVGPKFLRGTDINKHSFIDWSTVPYCPEQGLDYEKYALSPSDLLVIRMADPGKVALVEKDVKAVFASYLVRLMVNEPQKIPPLFLFMTLSSDKYQSFIGSSSGGSTRKSASAKLLTDFHFELPTRMLREQFAEQVAPMREMITKLVDQSASAAKARDLLLPRLMSGELTV
ncbi:MULTISPECIES: restriction endonuclease subunit S [unclassified Rhodanobacter]|uniref:restriction endonuclease subunit S n=1 Tax=unclassified Rhodanobacter TaxID=2621553 RepID=UPI001BE01AA1|nr:restriction endonuclease subunit S [Rhodanobacter sp. LX-99]MBT2148934.1 restriction endonuclease subunit S [Rhodanobacter sp. LX-100]